MALAAAEGGGGTGEGASAEEPIPPHIPPEEEQTALTITYILSSILWGAVGKYLNE